MLFSITWMNKNIYSYESCPQDLQTIHQWKTSNILISIHTHQQAMCIGAPNGGFDVPFGNFNDKELA